MIEQLTSTEIEFIHRLAEQLKTQDNRCTADPYFSVQEKVEIYGFEEGYADEHQWYGEEGATPDEETERQLDADYAEDNETEIELFDEEYGGVRTWNRVGVKTEWKFVEAFLSCEAAEQYVATQKHRHRGELRTYAESAHRNPEIRMLRAIIPKLANLNYPLQVIKEPPGVIEHHPV